MFDWGNPASWARLQPEITAKDRNNLLSLVNQGIQLFSAATSEDHRVFILQAVSDVIWLDVLLLEARFPPVPAPTPDVSMARHRAFLEALGRRHPEHIEYLKGTFEADVAERPEWFLSNPIHPPVCGLAEYLQSLLYQECEDVLIRRDDAEYRRQETDLSVREEGRLRASWDIRACVGPLLSAKKSRAEILVAAFCAADGRLDAASVQAVVREEVAAFLARVRGR